MAQSSQPFGFKISQRFIAFGATYDIIDEATGEQIFSAKKKIFTILPKMWIRNLQGKELITIKSNFWRTRWNIYQGDNLIGAVKFPLIKICGIKFDVELAGNEYTASDILGWSFTARGRDGQIGFILDKKVFRIKDTYKVEVYPPLEPIFGLAAALAIDAKFYQGNR
jgi:uncharacterized protein YxjI